MQTSNIFEDVLHTCPRILELLPSEALPKLLATSSRVRGEVHAFTTGICITNTVDLATLANMPLPRLRRLGITASPVSFPDAAELAQEPFRLSAWASEGQLNALLPWPSLQDLNLSQTYIDEAAAQSLVNANFPELRNLGLRECGLNAAAMEVFCTGSWPHLASLDLYGNQMCDQAVACFVMANWPVLTRLDLGNQLAPPSWQADLYRRASFDPFAAANLTVADFSVLSVLMLDDNLLDSRAMDELAKGPWPHLQHLSLRQNCLDNFAVEHLVTAHWPLLRCLDLFCNSLDDAAIVQLVKGQWPHLQILELGRNLFSNSAMGVLITGHWPQLTQLGLADVMWGSNALEMLLQGVWPLLQELDISGKFLPDEVKRLMFGVRNTNVLFASRERNHISEELCLQSCPVHDHWPALQLIKVTCRLLPTYKSTDLVVRCQ